MGREIRCRGVSGPPTRAILGLRPRFRTAPGALRTLLVLLLVLIPALALGYPTSLNSVPTADILEAGSIRMEFENDGTPNIGAAESISYGFTQIGLTPRLEFGIDRWDTSGEPSDAMNVKFLASSESDRKPAFALGMMDVTEGSSPSYYGVGTKTFGRFRAHFGYIHADYSRGPMLGFDHQIAEGTYLLGDWMQGSENWLGLGIYHEFSKNWALTFTYGFPNSQDVEKLVAVNLSYTIRLSK